MVNYCHVYGCANESDREADRSFFRHALCCNWQVPLQDSTPMAEWSLRVRGGIHDKLHISSADRWDLFTSSGIDKIERTDCF